MRNGLGWVDAFPTLRAWPACGRVCRCGQTAVFLSVAFPSPTASFHTRDALGIDSQNAPTTQNIKISQTLTQQQHLQRFHPPCLVLPRSRVKCVDIHSNEPWMLTALYNGHVQMWNYDTSTMVRTHLPHPLHSSCENHCFTVATQPMLHHHRPTTSVWCAPPTHSSTAPARSCLPACPPRFRSVRSRCTTSRCAWRSLLSARTGLCAARYVAPAFSSRGPSPTPTAADAAADAAGQWPGLSRELVKIRHRTRQRT
jgi:hypothetical protein